MKLKFLLLTALLTALGNASAQTWTQTSAPSQNWTAITMSADGKIVVAGTYGNGIFYSTNFGQIWQPTAAPIINYGSICCSADGSTVVAGSAYQPNGAIYVSHDLGVTWTTNTPAPSNLYWVSFAASADGKRLVGVSFDSSALVFQSTNGGNNWFSNKFAGSGDAFEYSRSICSSADGIIIGIASLGGTIFISTNAVKLSRQFSVFPNLRPDPRHGEDD